MTDHWCADIPYFLILFDGKCSFGSYSLGVMMSSGRTSLI
jgi:hypothetical protein